MTGRVSLRGRTGILSAREHLSARKHLQRTPNQGVQPRGPRGVIAPRGRVLTVVDLFAGAGGLGIGFLLARRPAQYRLIYSAEAHPIYVETLRRNYAALSKHRRAKPGELTPASTTPVDLRLGSAKKAVGEAVRRAGGVDVLVGGPPCQGFSNANRNSWHPRNPNNQQVFLFLDYIEALRPRVFVMENVPGMSWTSHRGPGPSFLDVIERRMTRMGYLVFPRVLDAVWYGVPQFRSRLFVLGLSRSLGYGMEDFDKWGPFPAPTHGREGANRVVTVRDALGDLPPVANGFEGEHLPYPNGRRNPRRNEYLRFLRTWATPGVVSDHITTRHAPYVIDRYRRIPQGGNWHDIAHLLTNYVKKERTHSNIYRRLSWDEPSVTIGHYRKSMLVHPKQHRGLSLREAARLQSFPDWFRFSGDTNGGHGGLLHKQQQLANAVCPLVSRALAEFIYQL